MKIALFILMMSLITFAGTDKMYVNSGWNLKGVSVDIENVDDFLDSSIIRNIYLYRDSAFIKKDTLKTIKSGDGFWINAKKNGWLEVKTKSDDLDIPTPRGLLGDWEDWLDEGYDWYCENINLIHIACNNDSNVNTDDINLDIVKGWNLKGSSARFKIKDIFDNSCVESSDSVVVYKIYNSKFAKYNKNSNYYVTKYSGFWVKGKNSCTLGNDSNPPEI